MTKQVYVVLRAYRDDGVGIIGVFTNLELATDAMEDEYHDNYVQDYESSSEEARTNMIHPDKIAFDELDSYFEEFNRECWYETQTLEGPLE